MTKNSIRYEELTGEEINMAKKLWIKDVQANVKKETKFGNLRRQLDLFQDDDKLSRCDGRLDNSPSESTGKTNFVNS